MASGGGPSQAPGGPEDLRERAVIARRKSDEEVHLSSPNPAPRDRHPGLGMAFEAGIPQESNAETRRRLSLDDARKEEYWKGYYDRKRREKEREQDRESVYYPDYPRRAQRYLEYDEERMSMRPLPRSGSVRMSRAPPPPTTHYRAASRYTDLPPRRLVAEDEDDYDEMYMAREPRRDRRGPPEDPPRRPSLDSSEYRIPFTNWMNTTVKGREFDVFQASGKQY